MNSNIEWEILITERMSRKLVRDQYHQKKEINEHLHLLTGTSSHQKQNTNILKVDSSTTGSIDAYSTR